MKSYLKACDERTFALGLLAASIVGGLSIPPLARMCEPIALPALFLVIVFSLAPFARHARRDLVSIDPGVWRVLLWQQVVLPSIAVAAGVLARFPDYVLGLIIVTSCSGALFASPALAELLSLDRRRTLQCMVLSTVMTPVTLFVFLSIFQGENINLDLEAYTTRALIFLVLPFGVFAFYRLPAMTMPVQVRLQVETGARWATLIALAIFGIGMMRSVSDQLATSPMRVLLYLLLTSILCVGMLMLTTIVMYKRGLSDALTAAVLSGFRNVGLSYALIGGMMGPELAVYVGVSMLPVFTAPLILKLLVGSKVSLDPAAV